VLLSDLHGDWEQDQKFREGRPGDGGKVFKVQKGLQEVLGMALHALIRSGVGDEFFLKAAGFGVDVVADVVHRGYIRRRLKNSYEEAHSKRMSVA